MASIQKGNIGTALEIDVGSDISTASDYDIVLKKPDGSIVTKDASFTTDGTDGKIRYLTTSNDLNMVGDWSIQAVITISGYVYYSPVGTFKVKGNL